MATFIVTCEHTEEECAELDKEMADIGVAEIMKGKDFYCSCPFGHHGGWIAVEGDDANAIKESLPPVFRSHASVYLVEAVRF
jgi:hypothetical protein